MRIVDKEHNTITDCDLSKGILSKSIILKNNIIPIDGINKIAYDDDDYEEVLMYIEKESLLETPSQLDILEAQVTYTAMMTDTLLETEDTTNV